MKWCRRRSCRRCSLWILRLYCFCFFGRAHWQGVFLYSVWDEPAWCVRYDHCYGTPCLFIYLLIYLSPDDASKIWFYKNRQFLKGLNYCRLHISLTEKLLYNILGTFNTQHTSNKMHLVWCVLCIDDAQYIIQFDIHNRMASLSQKRENVACSGDRKWTAWFRNTLYLKVDDILM